MMQRTSTEGYQTAVYMKHNDLAATHDVFPPEPSHTKNKIDKINILPYKKKTSWVAD